MFACVVLFHFQGSIRRPIVSGLIKSCGIRRDFLKACLVWASLGLVRDYMNHEGHFPSFTTLLRWKSLGMYASAKCTTCCLFLECNVEYRVLIFHTDYSLLLTLIACDFFSVWSFRITGLFCKTGFDSTFLTSAHCPLTEQQKWWQLVSTQPHMIFKVIDYTLQEDLSGISAPKSLSAWGFCEISCSKLMKWNTTHKCTW